MVQRGKCLFLGTYSELAFVTWLCRFHYHTCYNTCPEDINWFVKKKKKSMKSLAGFLYTFLKAQIQDPVVLFFDIYYECLVVMFIWSWFVTLLWQKSVPIFAPRPYKQSIFNSFPPTEGTHAHSRNVTILMQRFSNKGRKRLCARSAHTMHTELEAEVPYGRGPGPISGSGSFGVWDALSCYLSLNLTHSDTKLGKNLVNQNLEGKSACCPPPPRLDPQLQLHIHVMLSPYQRATQGTFR